MGISYITAPSDLGQAPCPSQDAVSKRCEVPALIPTQAPLGLDRWSTLGLQLVGGLDGTSVTCVQGSTCARRARLEKLYTRAMWRMSSLGGKVINF